MKIAVITGASSGMGREFALKLDRDEREPVDEEDEVESAIALIFEDELPGDDEGVILRVLEVDEINEIGALLAIEKIGHGHAVL